MPILLLLNVNILTVRVIDQSCGVRLVFSVILTVDFNSLWPRWLASPLGTWVLRYKIHNYNTKYGNQVPNLQTNFARSAPTLVCNFEAAMGQIVCSLNRLLQDLSENFDNFSSERIFNQNILQMRPRALSANVYNLRMSLHGGFFASVIYYKLVFCNIKSCSPLFCFLY